MSDFDTEERIQDMIDRDVFDTHLSADVLTAYVEAYNVDPDEDDTYWVDNAEEAYNGTFSDDAAFAENMASELGLVNENATWPNTHIDWEAAADSLMQNYTEQDGHYFRNL